MTVSPIFQGFGVGLETVQDGALIATNAGRLTPQDRAALVEHRAAILAILRDEVVA